MTDPWPLEDRKAMMRRLDGRKRPAPFTEDELRRDYVDNGLTQKQICKKWKIGQQTAVKHLRKLGFKRERMSAGDRYGRWTVLSFSHSDDLGRRLYRVKCDCGTERISLSANIRAGNSKSCGCFAREQCSKKFTKPDNHAKITAIINSYRGNAKKRGRAWDLTREDVARIIRQPCHYCGIDAGNCRQEFRYNGIDRVDNSGGYTLSNVEPCCRLCNVSKHMLSKEEFIAWAVRIARKHGDES